MQPALLFAIFLAYYLLLKWVKRSAKPALPLPPGPKGYPIIGNLLDIPSVTPWRTFAKWSKVYGDVMYLELSRQPTIVLNSAKAAFDLLEKRSDIYSDRQVSLIAKLLSWDWNIGLMPYSQKWRAHRREFHQIFNQREMPKFHSIQLRECRAFLQRLVGSPSNLDQHIRHLFTAIILKIIYDMDITDIQDDYVRLVREAVLGLSVMAVPGAFWVDYFPFLRFVPAWFPGFPLRKMVDYYRPIVETMRSKPFDKIQREIDEGKVNPSVTASLIERLQRKSGGVVLSPTDDYLARNVTGIAYAGGLDTISNKIRLTQ
ncbi:hypothetical protein QCA50_019381 [Cerrena zonata]|uniref:Cytochrome P450 n=1 Tax=Cerrena zonata TaxID=2478898 RepID=A0AAW0FF48_9APHY